MQRSSSHRAGEILMLFGFLAVVVGGLGPSFTPVDTSLSFLAGASGFAGFLLGAEAYLRTREEPYGD